MFRNLTSWIGRRFTRRPNPQQDYAQLSVAETFSRIYRTGEWGKDGATFHSGTGSRGAASEQYCAFVVQFIRENKIQSVVDLGCGDFAVGRQIAEATGVRYTGIDVVPELIEHHRATVQNPLVSFQCADITTDPLPTAELCLVRQVLQHLSNEEIAHSIGNLGGFSRLLITEHVPLEPQSINLDKPHGPDVRARYGSGVYLEHPPFSLPVVEVWSFPLFKKSVLRMVLLDRHNATGR
jgi:SAM-dependent methyltransferase